MPNGPEASRPRLAGRIPLGDLGALTLHGVVTRNCVEYHPGTATVSDAGPVPLENRIVQVTCRSSAIKRRARIR